MVEYVYFPLMEDSRAEVSNFATVRLSGSWYRSMYQSFSWPSSPRWKTRVKQSFLTVHDDRTGPKRWRARCCNHFPNQRRYRRDVRSTSQTRPLLLLYVWVIPHFQNSLGAQLAKYYRNSPGTKLVRNEMKRNHNGDHG